MKVISKDLGCVGHIHIHLAVVQGKPRPYLIFADEELSPIMMVDSTGLKKMIRILHLADATARKYLRSKEK